MSSSQAFHIPVISFSDNLEICWEKMQGPSGRLVSPDSNGDGFYDANANCVWRIEVTEDYVIRYTFETFAVEFSDHCQNDTLMVGTLLLIQGLARLTKAESCAYCMDRYPSISSEIDGADPFAMSQIKAICRQEE